MSVSLTPITIAALKTFQNDHKYMHISQSLAKHLKINTDLPLNIKIGSTVLPVHVRIEAIETNHIHFSSHILQEWKMDSAPFQLLARFLRNQNTLVLGPVIGILTDYKEKNGEANFRSIHSFCLELHQAAADIGGILYVFKLQDFVNGEVSGYIFKDDQWIKTSLPLPGVIYNRLHSRKLEGSHHFQTFRETINELNIPLFNDRFLAKDDVHELLYPEEHMQAYIPESAVADKQTIKHFLDLYTCIYLKPVTGSQGRSILRVHYSDGVIYSEASTAGKRGTVRAFKDYEHFSRFFSHYLTKQSYLVQRALSLKTFENRQLDFRILCHKNYQNIWKATSAVARISAEDQFVSNLARGGEMVKPLKILSIFTEHKQAVQQLSLMKELAVEVSSIIDQKSEGLFAELGIDIGLDEEGKLWIIEANVKPSKNTEEQTSKVRPSARAVIEYCLSMAFRQTAKGEE
ncbi:YheC/YheD family protein [Bacillus mesophilum]|uniref:YheC/YheD family protein n=1 Tax=Bacillus mesophilum TaxID=1071718 RepID=A0A7V7UWF5_9BACI|nr:YheC/YheD family protein [Bacillus mesophilum]KAB2330984.1 YheC/YheD family protein [Bacillus mesophilum]